MVTWMREGLILSNVIGCVRVVDQTVVDIVITRLRIVGRSCRYQLWFGSLDGEGFDFEEVGDDGEVPVAEWLPAGFDVGEV
jgi:hypothetical protein